MESFEEFGLKIGYRNILNKYMKLVNTSSQGHSLTLDQNLSMISLRLHVFAVIRSSPNNKRNKCTP